MSTPEEIKDNDAQKLHAEIVQSWYESIARGVCNNLNLTNEELVTFLKQMSNFSNKYHYFKSFCHDLEIKLIELENALPNSHDTIGVTDTINNATIVNTIQRIQNYRQFQTLYNDFKNNNYMITDEQIKLLDKPIKESFFEKAKNFCSELISNRFIQFSLGLIGVWIACRLFKSYNNKSSLIIPNHSGLNLNFAREAGTNFQQMLNSQSSQNITKTF